MEGWCLIFVLKGGCAWVIQYFKHKSLYNYAIMARGEDVLEVKGMINLVLVKKDILISMLDVNKDSEKNRT